MGSVHSWARKKRAAYRIQLSQYFGVMPITVENTRSGRVFVDHLRFTPFIVLSAHFSFPYHFFQIYPNLFNNESMYYIYIYTSQLTSHVTFDNSSSVSSILFSFILFHFHQLPLIFTYLSIFSSLYYFLFPFKFTQHSSVTSYPCRFNDLFGTINFDRVCLTITLIVMAYGPLYVRSASLRSLYRRGTSDTGSCNGWVNEDETSSDNIIAR